ncbi:MAG: AmmeMemoRadiSam system protein B [Candidatus Cloacimonetes bacterium]|jgi:AmmeMemoRadiSam system protein B|nr:AmmeMemoRadiSam system protein B [Candidatus Cloacimonadota bacterium]NLO43709.1 AmmeMemoRadiSam system protein B [Candidatus Cloacimonadota bacterium]
MIRKMAHAGTFYPRFAQQITEQVDSWLADGGRIPEKGRNLGLIVPHAGYVYSGKCAALGMASVRHENWDGIIVVHPSHQGNHFDFSLSPFDEYETPLGNIMRDEKTFQNLLPYADQNIERDYHALEHSLEVQLPLIRYFFPNAQICPVMMGRQSPAVSQRLAGALYEAVYKSARKILVMISTDLSHYYDMQTARDLDAHLIDYILKLDAEGMWSEMKKGKLEACGIGCIMALIELAKHYNTAKSELICYTNSGETSGMKEQVVGYVSARILI